MPRILQRDLCQRWFHSFEEDTEDGRVYRPASFKFPRSRGRTGFELKADGTCVYIAIGRGDVPKEVPGNWSLEEKARPILHLRLSSGEIFTILVISVRRDRLVMQRD